MSVTIRVEPRRVVTAREFNRYPKRSIAVDGYCAGPPYFNGSRLILNVNHHEGVNNVATRSSCDQMQCHVTLGLFDTFQADGEPDATIYVNDVDLDVVLATYVPLHPRHLSRPKLRELIRVEDLMDMSSGLWPAKRRWHLMRQLNWIGQPYIEARITGRLPDVSPGEMREMLDHMHWRVRATLFGRIRETGSDTRFEVLTRHPGWVMVREIGYQARVAMVERGIRAFVSYRGKNILGRHVYVLGRQSEMIRSLPIPKICDWLNVADGISSRDADRWGGASNRGGSPRERGSRLGPSDVALVVNAAVADSGPKSPCRALATLKRLGVVASGG